MVKEWTNQDLVDYISKFNQEQKDNVLKQILEADLIEKFLGTTNGRLILSNVVDSITALTMSIVRLSVENKAGNRDLIDQAAAQISVAYNFMYSIAKMAKDGEIHVEKMKKK